MIQLTVNEQPLTFEGDPHMPLLWFLRDEAGLTGTKFGCGIGACGACTVHVDGKAVRSCCYPLQLVRDRQVTTIEGLSTDRSHPVQQAWIAEDVPQCGYCQSGMIMAVSALLAEHPKPDDRQIDTGLTNLCRCATYHRIRAAVHRAADKGEP